MAKKRKPHVSTVRPSSGEMVGYRPVTEEVKQHDGVRVGSLYRIGGKVLKVLGITRRGQHDAWEASYKHEDGYSSSMPLAQIAKAIRTRSKHPVMGCYTVGPGRIRRRKVNRRGDPHEPYVVLYARKPGGPLLKFLGGGKFGKKGRAKLYQDTASADLAAWALKDTFPAELRGYRLFAK